MKSCTLTYRSLTCRSFFLLAFLVLSGCSGFQLRGQFAIPAVLQTITLCPSMYTPFQRVLKHQFKMNNVCIVEKDLYASTACPNLYTISITHQAFSDRNLAYGSNVQVNRVLLQFQVKYEILDPCGSAVCSEKSIFVERELAVNPNAILGTETDRLQVENELYHDAANQLLRQLTYIKTST